MLYFVHFALVAMDKTGHPTSQQYQTQFPHWECGDVSQLLLKTLKNVCHTEN